MRGKNKNWKAFLMFCVLMISGLCLCTTAFGGSPPPTGGCYRYLHVSTIGSGSVIPSSGYISSSYSGGWYYDYYSPTTCPEVRVTAYPDDGYEFDGWEGDCSSCGTNPVCTVPNWNLSYSGEGCYYYYAYCTAKFVPRKGGDGNDEDEDDNNKDEDEDDNDKDVCTLEVIKEGNGRVVSDPSGIDCGSDCRDSYEIKDGDGSDDDNNGDSYEREDGDGSDDDNKGVYMTLYAYPEPGWIFSGWGIDCWMCGESDTCSFMWNHNITCSAVFLPFSVVYKYPGLPPSYSPHDLPVFPENGADGVPTDSFLSWQEVEGAEMYEVAIYSDPSCLYSVRSAVITDGSTSWDITPDLMCGSRYYWRVRAGNGVGYGPWSDLWSFTTESCTREKIRNLLKNYYKYILGREADENGMLYWINYIELAMTEGQDVVEVFKNVIRTFYHSDEYLNKTGISEDEYLRSLYRAVLGRLPDPAGWDHWVNSGLPRDEILESFLSSEEFSSLIRRAFGQN